jgi:hypothetical protein
MKARYRHATKPRVSGALSIRPEPNSSSGQGGRSISICGDQYALGDKDRRTYCFRMAIVEQGTIVSRTSTLAGYWAKIGTVRGPYRPLRRQCALPAFSRWCSGGATGYARLSIVCEHRRLTSPVIPAPARPGPARVRRPCTPTRWRPRPPWARGSPGSRAPACGRRAPAAAGRWARS